MRSRGSPSQQQSNENNETMRHWDMETLCNTCDMSASAPALSVCTEQGAVYRIAPYTIQMWIYWGRTTSATTINNILFVYRKYNKAASKWLTGWPGCCMSRLWYAILHCVSRSRAECGVWQHKNVPLQLSSQRPESGPGYYTCFYPVNMNIVTAFLSEMHGNMTCIKANFIGWNIMLNVIFILWWW